MADEEKEQELYCCNGCIEQIPTHRARISCHSCPDYHLCANCFVIKQFTKPHTASHATLILRQSGFIVPKPPGFARRPAPALPPRPNVTVNTRQTMEVPTANWGALWSVLKAPLEKKDKKGEKASVDTSAKDVQPLEIKDAHPSSMQSDRNVPELPPSPPKSVYQGLESQAPSYPQPASWQPFFEADSTPTPIFVAFMSTVFSHLDPYHKGALTPEIYSDFLDSQGYELGSNVWKYARETDGGDQSKDVADLELGLYYADLNISHTLNVRTKNGSRKGSIDEPSSAIEEQVKGSMRFSANMPMLSRQGFIDLGTIEYLRDPSKGYTYIKIVVETYKIWTELGDVPRSVLPMSSIPKALLAEKMGSEPENTIPQVLLVEKLVQEEDDEIESDYQDGYASEELKATPPALPTRVKGGSAKAEALMEKKTFDKDDEQDEASNGEFASEIDGWRGAGQEATSPSLELYKDD